MKNVKIYINELVRIVTGALQLDINKVRNYTAFLADKFEAAEDLTTATRLRKLLDESDVQLKPTSSRNVPTIPVLTSTVTMVKNLMDPYLTSHFWAIFFVVPNCHIPVTFGYKILGYVRPSQDHSEQSAQVRADRAQSASARQGATNDRPASGDRPR